MRKFVAGFCCVVVAMQVLVGVPLVVCLAFYCLVQGGGGPVAVEVHSGNPYPATIAPPNYPTPQPYPPYPTNPVLDAPAFDPPLTPKTVTTYPTVAATLPPPDIHGADAIMIMESRERNGSPVPADHAEFAHALQNVAAESAASISPAATANEVASLPPPVSAVAEPGSSPKIEFRAGECESIETTLSAAVDRLYELATSRENEGNFSRADRLRSLARSIRENIDLVRPAAAPPASPGPVLPQNAELPAIGGFSY